jgi:hypothetical protein
VVDRTVASDRAIMPRTWLGRVLRPGADSSRSELVVGLTYSALMAVGCLVGVGRGLLGGGGYGPDMAFHGACVLIFAWRASDYVWLLRRDRALRRA